MLKTKTTIEYIVLLYFIIIKLKIKNKKIPLSGIEPEPRGWKPHILTIYTTKDFQSLTLLQKWYKQVFKKKKKHFKKNKKA